MARLGMDVDEVERISGQLGQQHGNLEQLINQVTTLVNSAVAAWDGQDAQHFQTTWNSQYKPNLTQASQAIQELSETAKRNAQEQREVSGR